MYLLDVAKDIEVEAELETPIVQGNIDDWSNHWLPAVVKILAELMKRQVPVSDWPQSAHWNWSAKMTQMQGLLAFQSYSVICNGMTQGLMRVDLTKSARIPTQKGKPLVFVDYLEAAPWNRSDLGNPPRFQGVGTALMTAAVDLSIQEGFKGRVGLHALPQANRFYEHTCGMTDLGPDPAYNDRMRYYEMTPEQAEAFL